MTIRYLISTLLYVLLFSSANLNATPTNRPDPDGQPTLVNIELYVMDIDEIDDIHQKFTGKVYLQATWQDKRLANHISKVYKLDDVWHPRLQILNKQKVFTSLPQVVEVKDKGEVIYRQIYFGNFSQTLNLKEFPFDTQILSFDTISTDFSKDEVKFEFNDKSGISNKFTLPDWEIKQVHYEVLPLTFRNGPEVYDNAKLIIKLKRHVVYYIFKFILPLFLIVFMSWIVFWIDPAEYSTQISISVTSMLTIIAYKFVMGNSLPKVPYLTRLDYIMTFATVLVFLTLLQSATTSILVRKDKEILARKIDYYCRFAVPLTFFIFIFIALS